MTERQIKLGLKNWHRWLGLCAALFLLIGAGTGFLLQHPEWLGSGETPPAALATDPGDADRLLRGTRWGVEESTDGGANWRELPMLTPPEFVHRIHFDPHGAGRVFAMGPGALVTSEDGGRVWEEIRFAPEVLAMGIPLVDITVSQGVWRVLVGDGMLVSRDQGETWIRSGQAAPTNDRDWRGLVHDLHTGHIFGVLGRRVAEGTALAVVFLTISGLIMMTRRNGRRSR